MPYPLVQNHRAWCWAVCAKLAGDIYKSSYPSFAFNLSALEKKYPFGMPIESISGFRPDCLGIYQGQPTVDLWQWTITRAVSAVGAGTATDDEKKRALRFVITGNPDSTQVEIVSAGKYGSGISLVSLFNEVLSDYLNDKGSVIGNYYTKERNAFHSVIINGNQDGLTLYDPWDGAIWPVTIRQLLTDGFSTNFGSGIIEWVQYIE